MLAHRSPDRSGLRSAMITFQIAGYLADFTGGDAEIKLDVTPATVRDALDELWQRHAGLRRY